MTLVDVGAREHDRRRGQRRKALPRIEGLEGSCPGPGNGAPIPSQAANGAVCPGGVWKRCDTRVSLARLALVSLIGSCAADSRAFPANDESLRSFRGDGFML